MNKHIFQLGFLFLVLLAFKANSQKPTVIKLNNPSFEDFPQPGKTVQGWFDCGFAGETPPDVQPGSFKVNRPAAQGNTYLGLVVRDNNTWESVSQRLNGPLLKGVAYKFSLQLCHSDTYISPDKLTARDVNFSTPVIIRIWGGSSYCGKEELLADSPPIGNTEWKEFKLPLNPKMSHTYIMIEAFYKVPTLFPYNGNILIDAASDIVPILKDEPIVAVVRPPVRPNIKPPVHTTRPDTYPAETPVVSNEIKHIPQPPPPKPEPKVKEGQIIRIEKLQFEATSTVIKEESFPALDKIYDLLAANPNVIVEVGGHTNALPPDEECDRLSTDRARAVADYLVNKGIDRVRVLFKGYGKHRPMADNQTPEGRKQNQRVEIKILSVNG